MKCAVEKLAVYVAPTCSDNEELVSLTDGLVAAAIAIDVSWVKPMQRRRLSQFAKMVLSCVHAVNANAEPIPVVFSSRHGDLHKTSDLLAQLVKHEPLSPTQFGLSVHNAVVGLLSILTHNTAPITAIAGGKDSLSAALSEAYMQLHQGHTDSVMVIHGDRCLPQLYDSFADEPQIDHCVAFILSKTPHNSNTWLEHITDTQVPQVDANLHALQFANAVISRKQAVLGSWRVTHG